MLSEHLLQLLRAYWKASRPQGWLFPGQNPVNLLTTRQLNRVCHAAAEAAGIPRVKPEGRLAGVHAHASAQLRHPPPGAEGRYPRHPEPAPAKAGVLLGHKKLETTALYAQVATRTLREVRSPLEGLAIKGEPPA